MKKTIKIKLVPGWAIECDKEGYAIIEGEEVIPEEKTLCGLYRDCGWVCAEEASKIAREHATKVFDEAFQEYCRLPLNDKVNYPSKIDFIRSKLEHM